MSSAGSGRTRTRALVALLALVPLAARGTGGGRRPDLNGTWQGSVTAGPATGSALSTLAQQGGRVHGTITLDVGDVHGTFALVGRARPGIVRVRARRGATRLAWHAVATADPSMWTGALSVRGGGHRMRGTMVLSRDASGGVHCGDGYFASDVMPRVLEPICAQCHVQGGLASAAPFRVTVGDPVATGLSARGEVDVSNPMQSKILLKPRGEMPHGGGQRIVPGSAEDQVLTRWVSLLTAPGCGDPGGPGRPTTGRGLYAASCASCHGADAGGGIGPAIRCALQVSDAVRNGRGTAMPSVPLADAEIALVAAYLDQLCTADGRTGSDLWAGNCSTCHGTAAQGGRSALGVDGPAVRCARDVSEPVRSGVPPSMPPFAMTDPDVTTLRGWLDGLCPPGTAGGAELWTANCARCHGADAGGTATAPNVQCATRVADALVRGRGVAMPAFPGLTGVDLDALTTWLGLLCTANGRTGDALYAGNCASCHGATAQGGQNGLGVRGPEIACGSAGDWLDAVRSGEDRMPAFPALGSADVDAMVTYVHAQFCPGG